MTTLTDATHHSAPPLEPMHGGVPRAFCALLFVVVVVKATAYWWGSWLSWPGEPLSVFAIYRGQDIEAYPLIRGLSVFNTGESGVLEWSGYGLSARIAPYLVHAALLAVAGPAGFMVGDVLVSIAAYILLARLFRLSGIGPGLARTAAVLLVVTTTNDFGDPGFSVGGIQYLFWGLRIPRPFVSDLFMFLSVVGVLSALERLRAGVAPSRWSLLAVGVGGSLLLQSDVFTAFGLGLGILIGVVALAVVRICPLSTLVRAAGLAGFSAAIVAIPLVVETVRMPEHVAERLGLFSVSRVQPPVLTDSRLIAALVVVLVVAASFRLLDRRSPRAAPGLHARWLFVFLAFGALLALPVSAVAIGSVTQIYHYPLALTRALWMAAVVIGLQAAQLVADRLRQYMDGRRPPINVSRTFILSAIALVSGPFMISTWRVAGEGSSVSGHMRTDVPEYASLPDYRRHFVSLTGQLTAAAQSDAVVLATFDHQVWSWWLTFGHGYSYLADACTTTLPDEEIEHRLASLARLLGMERAQFISLMQRKFMLAFWHSCARYQASALHTYAPLEDYAPGDQQRIAETRTTDSFSLIMPLSEERRLGALFDGVDGIDGRLDIIVMTKNDFLDGLAPPSELFDSVYQDEVFSMWRRKR